MQHDGRIDEVPDADQRTQREPGGARLTARTSPHDQARLIVALVWVIARRACEPDACVSTAREQLDARLARGEIDSEEYPERLEALSTRGRSPG